MLAATAGCVSTQSGRAQPAVESTQRLGAAERLSFVAEPTREYTYLPDEESVRYEEEFDGVVRTERMPFQEWGTRRATAHARNRLWTRFTEQYRDYEFITSSIGSVEPDDIERNETDEARTDPTFQRAVSIAPKLKYNLWYDDRTGDIVRKPPLSWESFISAIPRTVAVTMAFPEREYRAVLPGVCQRVVSTRPEESPDT
jgi:hypothetical protein